MSKRRRKRNGLGAHHWILPVVLAGIALLQAVQMQDPANPTQEALLALFGPLWLGMALFLAICAPAVLLAPGRASMGTRLRLALLWAAAAGACWLASQWMGG